MSESSVAGIDPDVQALRKSRNSYAVLKLEVSKIRSEYPEVAIISIEGDDDKIIYTQWLNRVRPQLRYIFLPCRGKAPLLSLRSAIQRDATGLSSGLYFFVDRDFDDLRGQTPGPDIFMTDKYSIENYLVCEVVLSSILDVEFHCQANSAVRNSITDIFRKTYGFFLEVTRKANYRLYVARQLKIETDSLPHSIGKIAEVNLRTASIGSQEADAIVRYQEAVSEQKLIEFEDDFAALEPCDRYRGKFAMLFFQKWLRDLADENKIEDRGVFKELGNKSSFRVSELTLTRFSTASSLPAGFESFVTGI